MKAGSNTHKRSLRERLAPLAKLPSLALAVTLATQSSGCVGIASGIDYPDVSDIDLDRYLQTPEGEAYPSVSLSHFKINPKTCDGIDTRMMTEELDQEDLTRFFATQKIKVEEHKARSDLYWYEFATGSEQSLKLRLAILRDNNAAAKNLHDSLLEHGPGWWGVRRGNLALLAPKASLSDAMRFAIKTKLVCWGMFTYAGVDDAYAVVGGYTEF
jgi:hypothetical protein